MATTWILCDKFVWFRCEFIELFVDTFDYWRTRQIMEVCLISFDTLIHITQSIFLAFYNLRTNCIPPFSQLVLASKIWFILVCRKANWSVYLSMLYSLELKSLIKCLISIWIKIYKNVFGSKAVLIMFSFVLMKNIICLFFSPLLFSELEHNLCYVGFIDEY